MGTNQKKAKNMAYARALRSKLKCEHMTMKKLSGLCGFNNYQSIQNYASGRSIPKIENMLKIEAALGWPIMEQMQAVIAGLNGKVK